MNYNIIRELTTICPPGAIINCVDNSKIFCILKQINENKFNIVVENGYILIMHKKFDKQRHFITISSHIDSVYSHCFFCVKDNMLYGTFDNSITNYASLVMMKSIKRRQVVYVFTDNEEVNNSTILNVPLLKNKMFLYNICLDVTPYCFYTHVATVENDVYKLAKINSKKIAFIKPYQSMNDESKCINASGFKSFSFCLTCRFCNNKCHSEEGGTISIENFRQYIKLLKRLIRSVRI